MDKYGDEDYDLDSQAASNAPKGNKKQAIKPVEGASADFNKMKDRWAAAEVSDGSELEDSEEEEEYGDKDFDMTPEAVDPVPRTQPVSAKINTNDQVHQPMTQQIVQ